MKNIVIINQPLNNRGDEAAHKSLVRALSLNFPKFEIIVLFLNYAEDKDILPMVVKASNVKYINITGFVKGVHFIQNLLLKLKQELLPLSFFHPAINRYSNYIKNADFVICAPGGISMGGFQNWNHIFNLLVAKFYKKKIFYYSRSFGPFPELTKSNIKFKNISLELLNYFTFISIRDAKTMVLADKLNLSYTPSIDTAFLDTPNVEIPKEILNSIKGEYIVFVPNSLTWHPAYVDRNQEDIDAFYLNIIDVLLCQDYNIIMLPQLYNSHISDYNYFIKLAGKINNDKVIVINDTYSSDIQQQIVSKSNLVIGARYHSIVFSINNCTPFISLSYEHKMTGLLDLLDLKGREIDITNIGNSLFDKEKELKKLQLLLGQKIDLRFSKDNANKIAVKTLDIMSKKLQ